MPALDLRLVLAAALPALFASGPAFAAEVRLLDGASAGLFSGGAAAVTDDGQAVFGHSLVVENGGPLDQTPVRWLRQPDGSFVADPLGEGATIFDLPRATASDAASDGSAASLYRSSKWTAAGGIACGAFCPVENENNAITADGTRVAAVTFRPSGPGKRVLLWSDAGLDVIDEVAATGTVFLNVTDVSADGTVAGGEYPGPVDTQPVLWTRNASNDWTRTLPGLPPGAASARVSRLSDDGAFAIVQWSPTDYGTLGNASILWSAANGYEDIGTGGCRPDALDADGGVAIGRCVPYLGRWTRTLGWEVFTDVPHFTASDVSADGRYAVGNNNTARWADLGPVIEVAACDNGVDDDGDGLVDFGTGATNDPGCASPNDLSENDPTLPCDDGVDNDGDGYVDYPADPACRTVVWDREDAQCQDGIDNDADGGIDFDGGASLNGGVPLAPIDSLCANKPYRNFERQQTTCGLGAEVALACAGFAWLGRRRVRTAR
jgi:hypothetical protein